MLTILAGVVGLLGSFLPSLLNFFTAKTNDAYQLELAKLQLSAAEKNIQMQMDIAQTKANVEEQQQLYSYDNGPSGSKFVDGLKSSIRPVITYTIFLMWIAVETSGFVIGLQQGKAVTDLIPIVWDQNTQAIFMSIIAFWFGSRFIEKYGIFPPINQPKTIAVNSKTVAFDPTNVDSIKAFQQAHGLTADGYIGPQTIAVIQSSKVPVTLPPPPPKNEVKK